VEEKQIDGDEGDREILLNYWFVGELK